MSERRFLSVEEAIHVLPDGDEIDTPEAEEAQP